MSIRRDADSGSDLLTRMHVAEQEIDRLREFRHVHASDHMAVLMKIEALELKLSQAMASHAKFAHDVKALDDDVKAVKNLFTLKTAEYDKERGLAGKIAWPVVIAVATAVALGIAGLLLRMYYLLQ